ncbi:MAG: helix-hairpin-helix domain-containing protein [Alkalibacterium sp.]|uniref:helix-hairpin-helix domain-containing protein n=1 Tax=Alkalibacterium sp. TaxID=1872447 RepID=UPI0039706004
MPINRPSNEKIAELLDQIAHYLEIKNANPFRIESYRDAAETVRTSDESIANLAVDKGQSALEELPDIGEGISRLILSYVKTGQSDMLQRLQGEVSPGELFKQVPGIGDELGERIAEELDVSTLEELEQAAHDGRLEKLEGFGLRKVENVRVSLAGMLSAATQRSMRFTGSEKPKQEQPSIATLLKVDQEYRTKAKAGELHKIAPKRFNPEGKAWLSILNTERDGWKFTALYSNTARAHELDKTDDWVVIYYERDGEENQATVVTETSGPLEGKRVVRGRETECLEYYQNQEE